MSAETTPEETVETTPEETVPVPAEATSEEPSQIDVSTLELGEWVKYETDESEGEHPAMITAINEEEGTISLAIFYKNRIDFISEYQL